MTMHYWQALDEPCAVVDPMHVDEKSDSVIVPKKPSNKEGLPSAETVEGRTLPEGNSQ